MQIIPPPVAEIGAYIFRWLSKSRLLPKKDSMLYKLLIVVNLMQGKTIL